MRVEQLTLRNFRNIEECSFRPEPQLNFLVGKNGQGKTSFIEALAFLATLRSFRGGKTDEVIRWGYQAGEVACTVVPDGPDALDWKSELRVAFTNPNAPGAEYRERTLVAGKRGNATKVAFINGKPYRSSTQYLSQRFGQFELGFHTVVFNPADHDLVRGEPAIRRAYLDRVLAAEDVTYLKTLQKYQRVLEQRNALLKAEIPPSREMLMGFTQPLVELGVLLTSKRLEWLERLSTRINFVAHQIAPAQPNLRAIYLSNWVPETSGFSILNKDLGVIHFSGQAPRPSLEILEQSFWIRLSALGEAELRSRSTLVGPHRDDWAFYLGSQPLKGHGSQGEVRSALLALKLSEIELFRTQTGHRPLLLLDDFSSELDRDRRAFLLKFLMETDLQVFVTTTEESTYMGKRHWVANGRLVAENGGHVDRTAEPDQSH